jgi:hypothetical protein
MTKRSRKEIDRDHAVGDLRAIIRKIKESDSLTEIRDLAGELQRVAYDVEDWAERSRTKKIAPAYLLIRKQRAEASEALHKALLADL